MLPLRVFFSSAPPLSQRVDFVDEHHAALILPGAAKQLSNALGANAHIHLHEIRAVCVQEGHACLARQRPGHQRLARARRPVKQHAPGQTGPRPLKALRVAQEAGQLAHLLHGFLAADNVVKTGGSLRRKGRLAQSLGLPSALGADASRCQRRNAGQGRQLAWLRRCSHPRPKSHHEQAQAHGCGA